MFSISYLMGYVVACQLCMQNDVFICKHPQNLLFHWGFSPLSTNLYMSKLSITGQRMSKYSLITGKLPLEGLPKNNVVR